MTQELPKKIVVIGGGYSSLAAASLLSHHGCEIDLFEAHTYLGGCASFFKRGQYKFDCGATTLSGLKPGRPLHSLLLSLDKDPKEIGQQLNIIHLETPMKLHLNEGQCITRHRQFSRFMEEMAAQFPGINHHELWEKMRELEGRLWEVIGASQYFPPKNLSDLGNLLKPRVLKKMDLGPQAFIPLEKYIPSHYPQELKALINEQLLISTQSNLEEVPTLLAAMGLSYPEDMHYSFGGISALAYFLKETIEKTGGRIHLRRQVKEVIPLGKNKGFELVVQRAGNKEDRFHADLVITSTTIWDTPKLFRGEVKKRFSKVHQGKEKGTWGAMMAYYALKMKGPQNTLYHQVHFKDNPTFNEGSLFLSFSHPKDYERAPQGIQTLTISTHCSLKRFYPHIENSSYEEIKQAFQSLCEEKFKEIFPNEFEILHAEIATPKTFERFTNRHHGIVGGLPHNSKNNILTFPAQETNLDGFYQIGDTTFPGQGIVGVTTGAMILAGKILKKNFLTPKTTP